jgi:tocopherol O-methyltransferase
LTVRSETTFTTLKERIARHYDELSPFYRDLWGIHIHHGYWKTGLETKEEAQEQLIVELASRAEIKPGSRILDVGCGIGGSAIFLSKRLGARVTGITLSQAQVDIGNDLARSFGADVKLLQMDAEALVVDDPVDVIWSIEALSHLSEKGNCFRSMAQALRREGALVIADWFRAANVTANQEREFLKPIEQAMLVPALESLSSYEDRLHQVGLRVTWAEDISSRVARTWDLALDLIKNPALWRLAATRGGDFVAFLEGFAAMNAGYRSKSLVYGALIARKA